MPRLDRKKANRIKEAIAKWDDYWKQNNLHYHEMTQFIFGEQWLEKEAKVFTDYKKTPLTVNQIAPQINHLLGEQRQNTPNLQIEPSDDVEEKTAEVRSALIKDISLNSNAKVIYQTCFEQSAGGGYSAYCLGTKYLDNDTFDQEITMRSFNDPTKCFWDQSAESPCKTDGMISGFKTPMSRKKFRSLYGKSLEKKIGYTTTDIFQDDMLPYTFSDEHSITVIEVFERKSKMETLYQLSNGNSVTGEEKAEMQTIEVEGKDVLIDQGEPVTIINSRTFPKYSIKHSKWAGDYELESTDFQSKQLPLIYVDQHSYYDKNGKQITRSFFKDAKDTQRYINYLRTQSAYLIKISRYDQFLVSKANIKGADTQQVWRDPSVVLTGLYYDESPNGNKPEQLRPPELSQSMMLQYDSAMKDMHTITGMFDTQMGEQGNEISGAAIDARTRRGNFNTYITFDSLNRAIAVGGEIIDEMIPNVYDTQRSMRLDMKDTGNTKVDLNKPLDDYGMQMQNDMSQGKFKIRLVPGASFEGQKAEGIQSLDMILSKAPQLFNLIGDLYAENLDMPNNIEIRNRLRTIIDPAVIQSGKTGQPMPPKPPQQDPMIAIKQQEIQVKMQQAQMQAQAKQQELQLKEQQLMSDSHQAGVNYATELKKLEVQKQELAAGLADKERSYQAEMARIQVDAHLSHAGNMTKILTHNPQPIFKDEASLNDTTNRNNNDSSSTT